MCTYSAALRARLETLQLSWSEENTVVFLAFEYLLAVKFATVLAFVLIELNTDPITLGLALNLTNKLDQSLLTFMLERNKLDSVANSKLGYL